MAALIISVGGEWRFVSNGALVSGQEPPPPAVTSKYLNLTGATGSGARVTEDGSLNLPGDQTVYALARGDDMTPAALRILCSKWIDAGNQRSYVWGISGTGGSVGGLYFQPSTDGTTWVEPTTPPPSPAITDNTWYWLRLRFIAATRRVSLATAPVGATPDPTANPTTMTWTEVAATADGTAVPSLYAATAQFTVGGIASLDYAQWIGGVLQLAVANAAGTIVFKLDPTNWSSGTSWTTSTGHTVTLVGAGATIVTL